MKCSSVDPVLPASLVGVNDKTSGELEPGGFQISSSVTEDNMLGIRGNNFVANDGPCVRVCDSDTVLIGFIGVASTSTVATSFIDGSRLIDLVSGSRRRVSDSKKDDAAAIFFISGALIFDLNDMETSRESTLPLFAPEPVVLAFCLSSASSASETDNDRDRSRCSAGR